LLAPHKGLYDRKIEREEQTNGWLELINVCLNLISTTNLRKCQQNGGFEKFGGKIGGDGDTAVAVPERRFDALRMREAGRRKKSLRFFLSSIISVICRQSLLKS
jgi:hypothetical protein